MELIVYKNDYVHFSHLPFENKWTMDMGIFYYNETLIHTIVPFIPNMESDPNYVCKVNLTNTVVGDFNQLTISGLALDDIRLFKGTIKPVFQVLSNIYFFEIEYDRA